MVEWWEMAASESSCNISIKKGLKIWKAYHHLTMLDNKKSPIIRFLKQKTMFSLLENAIFALRKRNLRSQETSTSPMRQKVISRKAQKVLNSLLSAILPPIISHPKKPLYKGILEHWWQYGSKIPKLL